MTANPETPTSVLVVVTAAVAATMSAAVVVDVDLMIYALSLGCCCARVCSVCCVGSKDEEKSICFCRETSYLFDCYLSVTMKVAFMAVLVFYEQSEPNSAAYCPSCLVE